MRIIEIATGSREGTAEAVHLRPGFNLLLFDGHQGMTWFLGMLGRALDWPTETTSRPMGEADAGDTTTRLELEHMGRTFTCLTHSAGFQLLGASGPSGDRRVRHPLSARDLDLLDVGSTGVLLPGDWERHGVPGDGGTEGTVRHLLAEVLRSRHDDRVTGAVEEMIGSQLTRVKRLVRKGSDLWELERAIEEVSGELREVSDKVSTGREMEAEIRRLEGKRVSRERAIAEVLEELEDANRTRMEMDARLDACLPHEGADGPEDEGVALLRSDIEEAEDGLEEARDALSEALEELRRSDERTAQLQEELSQLMLARSVLFQRVELERLERRMAVMEEMERELVRLEKGPPTPDNRGKVDLDEVYRLDAEIRRLEGIMDAIGIYVTVSPKRRIKGKVTTDYLEEPFDMEEGWLEKYDAMQNLFVSIGDVAELEITSADGNMMRMRERYDRLDHQLGQALEALGARDMVDVRRLERTRQRKERQVEALRMEVESTRPTRATLEERAQEVRETMGELTEELGEDATVLLRGDVTEMRNAIVSAGTRARAVQEELEDLAERRRPLVTRSSRAMEGLEVATEKLSRLMGHLETPEGRAPIRTGPREGSEDGELSYQEMALIRDRAENRIRSVKPLVKEHMDALAVIRERSNHLRGALAVLGNMGLYTRVAELEERLRSLEDRRQRILEDLEAVMLLEKMYREHREGFSGELHPPVWRAVSEWLGRLGHPVEDGDADRGFPVQALLELVRLAAARALASGETVPLVLVDPLERVDQSTAPALLELLLELGDELQLLVLTTSTDRYAGVPAEAMVQVGDRSSSRGEAATTVTDGHAAG